MSAYDVSVNDPVFQSICNDLRECCKGNKPRSTVCTVYIIQNMRTKSIKIGSAVDPLKRLLFLQKSMPEDKLVLLAVWYVPSRSVEFSLHKAFSHAKITGEWFALQDADYEQLMALMNPYPAVEDIQAPSLSGRRSG